MYHPRLLYRIAAVWAWTRAAHYCVRRYNRTADPRWKLRATTAVNIAVRNMGKIHAALQTTTSNPENHR